MKIFQNFSKKPRVEMMPLVDAVFLLLVFFLYAMFQMTVQRGIPVNLPHVSSGETSGGKEDYVVVSLRRDGEVYLNKDRVGLDGLYNRVIDERKAKGEKEIVVCLRGDADARHSQTVAVLEVLLRAEVNRIFFEVKQTPVAKRADGI